jgi:hypothetical protein
MAKSTRFSAASSSEIWSHLNALDDQGLKVWATYADLTAEIPAPNAGMQAWVVDTKSEYRCLVAGTWSLWSRARTAWTPTITGVTAGLSVAAGSSYYTVVNGRAIYETTLNCTGALTVSGTLNIEGMPVASLSLTSLTPLGIAHLNPAGTVSAASIAYSSTTRVSIYYMGGTVGAILPITASAPGTWSARSNAVIARWEAPAA